MLSLSLYFRSENKTNPFIGNESCIESLVTNHSPTLNQQRESSKTLQSGYKDIFKNPNPFERLSQIKFSEDTDSLGKHGRQMIQISSSVQREFHKKLFILWQSRGENCDSIYDEHLLAYFKSKSRMLHYVFTPLLFLPKWRWQANATRDHAANDFPFDEMKRNSVSQLLDQSCGRLRHTSGTSTKLVDRRSGNKSPTGK